MTTPDLVRREFEEWARNEPYGYDLTYGYLYGTTSAMFDAWQAARATAAEPATVATDPPSAGHAFVHNGITMDGGCRVCGVPNDIHQRPTPPPASDEEFEEALDKLTFTVADGAMSPDPDSYHGKIDDLRSQTIALYRARQGTVPLLGEREIAEAIRAALDYHDMITPRMIHWDEASKVAARVVLANGIALDRDAMAQAILSALQDEPYLEKAEYLDLTVAAYTAIDAIISAGRGRA